MRNYKVEIVQIERYILDIQAGSAEEAKVKATKEWNEIADNGISHKSTAHYYQHGDTETDFGTVYDVTGTDDAVEENQKGERIECSHCLRFVYPEEDNTCRYCDHTL